MSNTTGHNLKYLYALKSFVNNKFYCYDNSMKLYREGLILIGSFLLVFFWQNSPLSKFTTPAIGFLIFMFILTTLRNKKDLSLGGPINFFLLNTVLLLFIFTTGGLLSDLFFIVYFLLFGLVFIMEPKTVFLYPVGILFIFYPDLLKDEPVANIIKIASIFLLSPVAYFVSMQFNKNQNQTDEVIKTKERAVEAADEISENVGEVINSAKDKLDPSEVEKLNEILEETQDLREEKPKN